jgi:hypothetical protein
MIRSGRNRSALVLYVGISLSAASLAAQRTPGSALCPLVVGVYPVDFNFEEPLKQRQRFEIRACGHGMDEI